MPVSDNIRDNLDTTYREMEKAVRSEAQIIVLPEIFCCPYENLAFTRFAQPRGAQIWRFLRDCGKKFEVTIADGSFLALDGGLSTILTTYLILREKR